MVLDEAGKLLERHPELFEEAKAYEKVDPETGKRYTWAPGESLEEIAKPERLAQIRRRSADKRAVVHREGTLVSVLGEQARQHVLVVQVNGSLPGEVVEADMVEPYPRWLDAEVPGEPALEADRHVAQPDGAVAGVEQRAGDDADRIGEVDDPRVGSGELAGALGDVEDDGNRAQRLRQAARARGLLANATAVKRPGLVAMPGRLTADPQLKDDGAGGVESGLEVGRPAHLRRVPVMGHDPLRDAADQLEPVRVRVDQHELVKRERVAQPRHAVDQLRCVSGAAADNHKLHLQRRPSAE